MNYHHLNLFKEMEGRREREQMDGASIEEGVQKRVDIESSTEFGSIIAESRSKQQQPT